MTRISREWCMPNAATFSMTPVRRLIERWLREDDRSLDPFAGQSALATCRNDLSPHSPAASHISALQFLELYARMGQQFDFIFFDPPYSPRQISECYKVAGLTAKMEHTQNARLYKSCREYFAKMSKPGTRVLQCGWNSTGMRAPFVPREILLLCHGSAHNDTICRVDEWPADDVADSAR